MSDTGQLGADVIIGIAAGVICLIVLCIAGGCYMCIRNKQNENRVIELNKVSKFEEKYPNLYDEGEIAVMSADI